MVKSRSQGLLSVVVRPSLLQDNAASVPVVLSNVSLLLDELLCVESRARVSSERDAVAGGGSTKPPDIVAQN